MNKKHWIVNDRTENSLVDQLLKNRKIIDKERFLYPDYERDSHDPFLLPGMKVAIERIEKALKAQEHIVVFADYDADGIPGGALLVKLLSANGAVVSAYIPDREKEGYGLNNQAIDKLKKRGAGLIITVDLGITNRDQVNYARSIGIDTIVTDHHHIDDDRIPIDAVAVVHPALAGSKYPFAGLAGGGVAWKLSQALAATTGKPNLTQLKWWLELATISTVCDIVPLVDENRMIVHFGLKVLSKTKNPGLIALYQAGGIKPELISEYTVGFQIGPRINAPGRVDSATLAFDLLTETDSKLIEGLAQKIELQNVERRSSLERINLESVAQVDALGEHLPAAIVLVGKNWPPGLIGLAASRLIEKVHRPVILLGDDGSGTYKGSGRSIESFNLLEAITAQKELLGSYGGHEKAAGLQIKSENFPEFQRRFNEYAEQQLSAEDLAPTIHADAIISPDELTPDFVDELNRFAPFGNANPRPSFIVEPLVIADIRTLGANKDHLKLKFKGTQVTAIGFRFVDHVQRWKVGDTVSIFCQPGWNEWQGQRTIELSMKDIREYEPQI